MWEWVSVWSRVADIKSRLADEIGTDNVLSIVRMWNVICSTITAMRTKKTKIKRNCYVMPKNTSLRIYWILFFVCHLFWNSGVPTVHRQTCRHRLLHWYCCAYLVLVVVVSLSPMYVFGYWLLHAKMLVAFVQLNANKIHDASIDKVKSRTETEWMQSNFSLFSRLDEILSLCWGERGARRRCFIVWFV